MTFSLVRAVAALQGPFGKVLISICLFVITTAVYAPARRYEFVNLDDPEYVVQNGHVMGGTTFENVLWAFTHAHSGNWHPLTWISHMIDCEVWGLDPGGHHMTNVAWHGGTAAALFLVLSGMTGALWRSAFVASLFALHPLRVESVAWIAERKDVLSAFFWVMTMAAYARYCTSKEPCRAHVSRIGFLSSGWYWLTILFFTLGLMSKPMGVTLPFVLLLLDYWPLRRLDADHGLTESARQNAVPPGPLDTRHSKVVWLILEKTPLFLLAAASCVVTFVVQNRSGAVTSSEGLTLTFRLANAAVSYVAYLVEIAWPEHLAVFYPYRLSLSALQIAGASVLLVCITFFAASGARRFPWLLVGWLWYLGTLVPVIGLVQIGMQAMADRYTYVPAIGVFVVAAWGLPRMLEGYRAGRALAVCTSVGILILCTAGTARQLPHWHDSIALFQHALASTNANFVAHDHLAIALLDHGRAGEAMDQWNKALGIRRDATVHSNLANGLFLQGKIAEAAVHCREALRLRPEFPEPHYNLGNVLRMQGDISRSVEEYATALRLRPGYAEAKFNLGHALFATGRTEEATGMLAYALRSRPDLPASHCALADVMFTHGKISEAVLLYGDVLRVRPNGADAHRGLGNARRAQGRVEEAIVHYTEALRLEPGFLEARNSLGNVLAQEDRIEEAIPHYLEVLRLKLDHADAHNNLGSVLRMRGNFGEAVAHYNEARRLKPKMVEALENLAWIRAACADPGFRDGSEAVSLAMRCIELTNRQDPSAFDVLAAAWAESGQFNQAVEAAQQAHALALSLKQVGPALEIEERLELYRLGLPYRTAR